MRAVLSLGLASAALAAPAAVQKRDSVQGFDISDYQSGTDFSGAYSSGARFVIIKATEGTSYTSDQFSSQYDGATSAGFIRGAYHFAHPDESDGATQATFFHSNGGGWSGDGITLPGMLDIEYNPSGDTCYGLSAADMVSWIQDFVSTYQSLSSRYPIIYSTANWWEECTGNSDAFSSTCPLNVADYNGSPGTIPGGWPYQTIWQNTDDYSYGGDSDVFNGSEQDLQNLATGS